VPKQDTQNRLRSHYLENSKHCNLINISAKPCQYRRIHYLADNTIGDYQERYISSHSTDFWVGDTPGD